MYEVVQVCSDQRSAWRCWGSAAALVGHEHGAWWAAGVEVDQAAALLGTSPAEFHGWPPTLQQAALLALLGAPVRVSLYPLQQHTRGGARHDGSSGVFSGGGGGSQEQDGSGAIHGEIGCAMLRLQ